MTDFVIQGVRVYLPQVTVGGPTSAPVTPDWSSSNLDQTIGVPVDPGITNRWGQLDTMALDEDGDTLVASIYDEKFAYIYGRTGTSWTQTAQMMGGSPGSQYGFIVGVDITGAGDYAAIAARTGDFIHVFNSGDNWTTPQTIDASTTNGNHDVLKLSPNGDLLVTGARNAQTNDRGQVRVYERESGSPATYSLVDTINPSSAANQFFGRRLDVGDDRTIVINKENAEEVRTYTETVLGNKNWTQDGGLGGSGLMGTISMSGNFWAGSDVTGATNDRIRIYKHSTGSNMGTYDTGVPSGASAVSMARSAEFFAYAISNESYGSPPVAAGRVYIYQATGSPIGVAAYTQVGTINSPTPTAGGGFGASVNFSHDGTRLAVGAPGEDNIHVFRASNIS